LQQRRISFQSFSISILVRSKITCKLDFDHPSVQECPYASLCSGEGRVSLSVKGLNRLYNSSSLRPHLRPLFQRVNPLSTKSGLWSGGKVLTSPL
jgi:hypothetical protein